MKNTHAVLYNCGKLSIMQIIFPEKKFTVPDGKDKDGRIMFRTPRIGDSCNGCCIVFLGEKDRCEKYINKN